MPSLDDLRKRIASVKSTQKITKAMKMVAAAKLRKAQEMAEKGRPYSEKMNIIIQNLSKAISDPSNAPRLLVGTGEDKSHLCIVMTADRGLCGGFNTNIVKQAKNYFNKILKDSKTLKIITVGTKGLDQLKRDYGKYIIKKINFKDKKKLSFKDAETIGNEIVKLFKNKEFDKCIIFFNKFKNVMTQVPQAQQVIPAKKEVVIGSPEFLDDWIIRGEMSNALPKLFVRNIKTNKLIIFKRGRKATTKIFCKSILINRK